MQKKLVIVIAVLILLLGITGFFVYKTVVPPQKETSIENEEEDQSQIFEDLSQDISIDLTESSVKDNAVMLSISGLNNNYLFLEYELSYDSEGLIKGVNSGSKPIDLLDKSEFEREIYLGTCSRNVCRADTGVSKISVVIEFTRDNDKKSQFIGDFDI